MRWQINGLCVLFACVQFAQGADDETPRLKARPVRVEATTHTPADLQFKYFRLNPGLTISYLVEGENLAKIERIQIRSISTPDGMDLLGSHKERDGEISRDGKYVVFPIHLDKPLIGKAAQLKIEGDVELLVGLDRKQIEIELTKPDSQPHKLGPFTLIATPNKGYSPAKGPSSFVQHAPPPVGPPPPGWKGKTAPLPRMLDTRVQSDPRVEYLWTVKVTGPEEKWENITFTDGDRALKGLPYSELEFLAFDLPKPSSGKLKVTIDYFSSTKLVKVPMESLDE